MVVLRSGVGWVTSAMGGNQSFLVQGHFVMGNSTLIVVGASFWCPSGCRGGWGPNMSNTLLGCSLGCHSISEFFFYKGSGWCDLSSGFENCCSPSSLVVLESTLDDWLSNWLEWGWVFLVARDCPWPRPLLTCFARCSTVNCWLAIICFSDLLSLIIWAMNVLGLLTNSSTSSRLTSGWGGTNSCYGLLLLLAQPHFVGELGRRV